MRSRNLLVILAAGVLAGSSAACAPRRSTRVPERPSREPVAEPEGTPDPRVAALERAQFEADLVTRAKLLEALAAGAPPSDRVARNARVALVRTYAQAGDLDAMRRAAGELEIADDSEGADLLNVMAYAYAVEGRNLERALQYSRRALEVVELLRRPDGMDADAWRRQTAAVSAAYRDTLGWILHRAGDHRGAVRELRRAAEVLPDDPTVSFHLGVSLLAAEEAEKAVEALVRSAVADGEESPKARSLAFDAGAKAGLDSKAIEARMAAARAELETRVRQAALANPLREAPRELTASDTGGAPVRLLSGDGDVAREPVVLVFWGAFSPPSLRLLRILRAAHDPGRARLVTVSLDPEPGAAVEALAEAGITAPLAHDPEGRDAKAFQVRGLPTLLVLDAQGRVRYRNEGILPGYEVQLKAQLESLGDHP